MTDDEILARAEEIRKTRQQAYIAETADVERRVKQAHAGRGDFALDELRFARATRCPCGHGMAYPVNAGIQGSWDCSAILRGIADRDVKHGAVLPFAFYDLKSEQDGVTTRPAPAPIELEP